MIAATGKQWTGRVRMRVIAAIAVAMMLAFPAGARPLTPDEDQALTKAMDSYLRAIGTGNAETIVKGIPPRIMNIFAGTSGIEAKNLEKTLVDQTAGMLKSAKFTDIGADRSALDAQDVQLADGSVVTWVVVPTAFTAETATGRTRNEQPMLALREGEKWYFVRIDGDQQKQMVALAYPFLAGVDFPAARVAPAP
jgi:hypothetical protein